MKYAAVYRTFLRTGPAVVASASALGTWLRLYGHAAELEQWGGIPGCKGWPARAWMATAMISIEELEEAVAAGLCEWRGNDLVVLGYDIDGQTAVEKLRSNGRRGGRPAKTKSEPNPNQAGNHLDNQAGNPSPFPSSPLPSLPNPLQPIGGGGESSASSVLENGSDGSGGSAPEAHEQGEIRTSHVKEIIKRLQPIATKILGKGLIPAQRNRRDLGVIIKAANEGGNGAQTIEGIPRWYARFLRETDHKYLEGGHNFSLFLRDFGTFTTPTERMISRHEMNGKFPWATHLARNAPVLFDAVVEGMDPDGDEFGYVNQRLLAALRIHLPGVMEVNKDQLRAVAEKLVSGAAAAMPTNGTSSSLNGEAAS